MNATRLLIRNAEGLHARPASLFVRTASQYKAAVEVRNATTDSPWVSAKSMLRVLSLGVTQNCEIELRAEGDDAAEALSALTRLVEADFSAAG